jgi:DNA-binding response OmpR family regulator
MQLARTRVAGRREDRADARRLGHPRRAGRLGERVWRTKHESPVGTVVVVVLDVDGSVVAEAARRVGANDRLVKPFHPALLLDKAKAMLS